MQYFNSLPKIIYRDKNNISTIYTNLISRANIIPNILRNVLSYYQYDIKDDDTPEIIAHKYYGDINRFWIVLYSNQILDPQWDWPLSSNKFNNYVESKLGNTKDDLHHYEKVITTTNQTSGTDNDITTTIEKYEISTEDYTTLSQTLTNGSRTYTYSLPNENITLLIEARGVTNFDYEYDLNESKRSIQLLNKDYAAQLEEEFMTLMETNV